MQKVYSRILWENYPSEQTPLNEQNLNKIDVAIDTIDDRIVNFDTTKANQSDLLQSLKNITYNESTGLFIFTWWNGTAKTVDLNVEKIPVSFSMSNAGVITMTNTDGTKYTADVSKLIKTYTFNTSSDIRFNTTTDANGNKTITAFIVDGSVTENKLEPNYLANIKVEVAKTEANQTAAETAQRNAEIFAEDAEAWAKGTKDGINVSETDETYRNNSKYYSEQSAANRDIAKSYVDEVERKGEEAVKAIENAYDIAAPKFEVDVLTGHLYYEGGRFTFSVNNDNGHLEWGIAL